MGQMRGVRERVKVTSPSRLEQWEEGAVRVRDDGPRQEQRAEKEWSPEPSFGRREPGARGESWLELRIWNIKSGAVNV